MDETPEIGTESTCKNCKKPIVFDHGILQPTWKHQVNLLQICSPFRTDYAEPEA